MSIDYKNMKETIMYKEGTHVVVHDNMSRKRQQMGEIVTNPFTGKQIIDMDSGVIALDEELPDGVSFIIIPAEDREAMWAILNNCYDRDKEIVCCDNCGTKMTEDQASIWSEGLAICNNKKERRQDMYKEICPKCHKELNSFYHHHNDTYCVCEECLVAVWHSSGIVSNCYSAEEQERVTELLAKCNKHDFF